MVDQHSVNARIRCSDADRLAAAEALASHARDGRLDADEVAERTAAALTATTYAELAVLLADLPLQPRGEPAPSGVRHHRLLHVSPLARADAYIALLGLSALDAALYVHAWLLAPLTVLAALRLRALVHRREPPPA